MTPISYSRRRPASHRSSCRPPPRRHTERGPAMRPLFLTSLTLCFVAAVATDAWSWGSVTGPRGGTAYRGPFGGGGYHGPNGGSAYRGPWGRAYARGPNGGFGYRGPYGG